MQPDQGPAQAGGKTGDTLTAPLWSALRHRDRR
jgi:hypothetical protein